MRQLYLLIALALSLLDITSVNATKPISFYSMLPELQNAFREYASRRLLNEDEGAASDDDRQNTLPDWGD